MAQDYNVWLAANVLNEQQYISYRNVSRALKVHSNIAKQMLFEFHRKQNSKKPGIVHATYLITGTKRSAQTNGVHSQQDGEDSIMRSSPSLPSSSMPRPEHEDEQEVIPVRSIMLVKEEHLDQAKALFETITGIHIYSLQVNGLSDVHALTECNRKVASEYASDDPLKDWKQYGAIQNPNVKRRTGKRPSPAPAPVVKSEPVKAKAAAAASKTSAADLKADSKPPAKNADAEPSKSIASKPPTNKRQDSSIFKSFAKSAAKPKKTESQDSAPPAPAAAPEDVDMTGFSDEDDEEADGGLTEEIADIKAPTGKSKKDRKAELDAMMELEDEPMEDADTPAAEEEEDDDEAIDKPETKEAEPKETVVVENGRRRGRRRVMKKKTIKDEDGYLVTREEAAWESFSEEEPAAKKPKVQAPVSNKAAAKKGGNPGQGNIMSFFSKK